ncbi:hypothetical protein TWF696_001467 [Orbilia brochopaga]|uniref:Uncharacterized protein n=1 Tax=Orbilia brochopaga TaxID=3140254 RepID=A0AAV9U8Y2_9PEZI
MNLRERLAAGFARVAAQHGNIYESDDEQDEELDEPQVPGTVRMGNFQLVDGNPPQDLEQEYTSSPAYSVRDPERRRDEHERRLPEPARHWEEQISSISPGPEVIPSQAPIVSSNVESRPRTPAQRQAGAGNRPYSSSSQGITRPTSRAAYTPEEENYLVFANERWPGSAKRNNNKKAAGLDEWLVFKGKAQDLPYRSSQSSWEHYDYVRRVDPSKPAPRLPLKQRWRDTYDTPQHQAQRAEMAAFFNQNGSPQ